MNKGGNLCSINLFYLVRKVRWIEILIFFFGLFVIRMNICMWYLINVKVICINNL